MSFPIRINASNDLQVEVFLHEFYLGDRNRKCWTYITKGLKSYQQKEMTLSLLLEDDDEPEKFPKTPVKIFQLLENIARDKKAVDVADSTRLGKAGFFGFAAVYYLSAIQYEGLPDLSDHLALMLVHQSEYEFAKKYGFTRLLSRIGKFCSSFPYPTWNSRQRPALFEDGHREDTILEDIDTLTLKDITAELIGNQVLLTVNSQDVDPLLRSLKNLESRPFALHTSLSHDVNAGLSWEPGQEKPGAYTAPDEITHIGAAFVQFEAADSTSSELVEDGFSFRLSRSSTAAFCTFLEEQKDNEMLDTDSFQLKLRWQPQDISQDRPAIGYHHLAAWTTLDELDVSRERPISKELSISKELPSTTIDPEPTTDKQIPAEPPTQIQGHDDNVRVILNKISDVTMNAVKRVASNPLNEYINSMRSFLSSALLEEAGQFHLTIRATIERKKAQHKITANVELNPEFIDFMEEGLNKLVPCYTSSPLTFEFSFTVNP